MRFSVLLPTRDRLELLRLAVESVRRQDYDDWEVVVSDNHSTADVCGYVTSLDEPRIRCVRTLEPLPVTASWNNALLQSRGDYIVMLGDDDCLLKGYFSRVADLISEFAAPEVIHVEAVQFAYPRVMPGHDKAFLQTGYSDLLRGLTAPAWVPRAEALAAVRKSMALRQSFGYNMQHSLISRRLIERIAPDGSFFRSPYPDYYVSNVMLLEAERVLAVPEVLVAIGITPKSFGYFYFNDRADEGTEFLGSLSPSLVSENVRRRFLPGNPLLTAWYASMACVEHDYGSKFGVRVDQDRYRYLQVVATVRRQGLRGLRQLWPELSASERVRFAGRLGVLHALPRVLPRPIRRRVSDVVGRSESPWPQFDAKIRTVEYQNILELFDALPSAAR